MEVTLDYARSVQALFLRPFSSVLWCLTGYVDPYSQWIRKYWWLLNLSSMPITIDDLVPAKLLHLLPDQLADFICLQYQQKLDLPLTSRRLGNRAHLARSKKVRAMAKTVILHTEGNVFH